MFTHSVVVPEEDLEVNDTPTYDLPVSPMSHCLITLKFQQNSANAQMAFQSIALMLDKVEVLYKGSSVISLNGLDLLACGLLVCDFESWGVNADGIEDDFRSFTFLVPFGRQLYSPVECYPSTSRGELVLALTMASAFTLIDAVKLQVEAVELPDAHPDRFLKMTTSQVTPTSSAEFDVELPIGNQISDVVLWGTKIPDEVDADKTIAKIQIRKNNSEFMYSTANFETLHNMMGRLRPPPGYWNEHVHRLDAAAFAQWDDTSSVIPADHILSNHLLVPFDVRRDGVHMLRTDDANDLNIRIKPDAAAAVRVIPCEVVAVSAR